MSKKILKFDDVEVNKKELHTSKQLIALDLEDINKILVSDKFKHSDKGFQYFAGYENDNIIRSLCIIFSQMSRYIKHFVNDGKNMPLKIEGDNALVKYIGITNRIKEKLGVKFLSDPVFDEKYIKNKVKTFNGVANTIFQIRKLQKKLFVQLYSSININLFKSFSYSRNVFLAHEILLCSNTYIENMNTFIFYFKHLSVYILKTKRKLKRLKVNSTDNQDFAPIKSND